VRTVQAWLGDEHLGMVSSARGRVDGTCCNFRPGPSVAAHAPEEIAFGLECSGMLFNNLTQTLVESMYFAHVRGGMVVGVALQ